MKRNFFIVFIVLISSFCFCLDNPSSPDYIGDFRKRIKVFENDIQIAQTTYDFIKVYKNLEIELDKELNIAYKLLIEKLDEKNKNRLKLSQKEWIRYRDLEFEFIKNNFTHEEFGSSYALTVGDFKVKIIKNRIEELLWYLKQY